MTTRMQCVESIEMRAVQEERQRAAVAQCWTTQLCLLLGMYVLALFQAAIKDDFSEFVFHPGKSGWNITIVLISLYAAMAVLVRVYDRIWFRWLNAPMLFMTLVLPVRHQVGHLMEGRMPDQAVTLEVLMVLVAILGAFLAVRWARENWQERGIPEGNANAI